MKEVRTHATETEKIAQDIMSSGATLFNINEKNAGTEIQKARAAKFNDEVEAYNEKLDANQKKLEEAQDDLKYDINKAEIKPMFARVLIKPFKVNPFQKMQIKNGLIITPGGYDLHAQFNEQTGKYEEQDSFIVTGCVIEIGPDVKYLKEGDVVYYRKDTSVPVPFFHSGFVSLGESQIIAVVNEGLQDRFDKIK